MTTFQNNSFTWFADTTLTGGVRFGTMSHTDTADDGNLSQVLPLHTSWGELNASVRKICNGAGNEVPINENANLESSTRQNMGLLF